MSEPKGFCVLVRQAKAGDSVARTELLEQFRPCVVQICRETSIRGGADISTSDLTQEVWLRVLEKLEQFHGSEDDQQTAAMFFNWVRVTARGVVLNLLEARNAQCRTPPGPLVWLDAAGGDGSTLDYRTGLSPQSNDATASEIAMAGEEAKQISDAIASLTEKLDREIITSRFYSGDSLKQIAERLGISYDKARERFHDALTQLEQQLSNLK